MEHQQVAAQQAIAVERPWIKIWGGGKQIVSLILLFRKQIVKLI